MPYQGAIKKSLKLTPLTPDEASEMAIHYLDNPSTIVYSFFSRGPDFEKSKDTWLSLAFCYGNEKTGLVSLRFEPCVATIYFLALSKPDESTIRNALDILDDFLSGTLFQETPERGDRGTKPLVMTFRGQPRFRFQTIITGAGFQAIPRLGMELSLNKKLPEGIILAEPRPYNRDDLENIASLMHEATVEDDRTAYVYFRSYEGCKLLLSLIENGRYGIFHPDLSPVLLLDSKTVGFCLVTENRRDSSLLVVDIAVEKAFRGRGIGKSLMLWSIRRAAEKGFRTLTLAVTRSNRPALLLYSELGFRITSTFTVFTRNLRGHQK